MGKGGHGKGGVRNRGRDDVKAADGVSIKGRKDRMRFDGDDPDAWIGWPFAIFIFLTSGIPLVVGIYYTVWALQFREAGCPAMEVPCEPATGPIYEEG